MRKCFSIVILFIIIVNVTNGQTVKELYKKAEKAEKQQNFEAAIDYYYQILAKDTNQREALFYRGLDYLMLGEFDLSILDFDKYIEKDTTNADAYNNRGLAKSYTDKAAEAFDDFRQAIALAPKMEQAYINRAALFIAVNDDISAKQDIETAMKLNPKNPSIYLNLARVEYRQKDYKNAIDNYSKSIKMGLGSSDVYYKRGNSYYHLGDFRKAINDYTKAVQSDSTNLDALNNRAMSYENLGVKDSAELDRKLLKEKNIEKKENLDDGVDLTKTKSAFHSSNTFGIKIPDEFYTFRAKDSLAHTLFFTREEMTSKTDVYAVGGYIEMFFPTDSLLGTANPDDLLDYWKGISTQGFQYFNMVRPEFQKTKPWGKDWSTIYTKTKIRINNYTKSTVYFNYGMAKPNMLINVHFEVPEELLWKYEKFFEDAIDNIIVY